MKIRVTEKASVEINNSLTQKKSDVRILVKGFGWGGPVFGIALDEQNENDYVQTIGDTNYVVENELIDVYNGFEIDFRDSFYSKGFYVSSTSGGSSC